MYSLSVIIRKSIHLNRNGTESQDLLPLWIPPEAHTASTGILGRVHDLSSFRNGTESRKLLPLWKHPEAHTASTGILNRITGLSSCHNGTESRKLLPLWKHPEAHTGTEGSTLFAAQHFFDYLIDGGAEAWYGGIGR